MYVNSLSSSKTQIAKDYYSLPVCKPQHISQLKQNIGNVLSGEEYSNTPLVFGMMKDEVYPQVICKRSLSVEDVNTYKQSVEDEYNVQWLFYRNDLTIRMIDDLPAAIMVTSNEDPNDYWFEDTHPIGYKEDDKVMIYNHVRSEKRIHCSWRSLYPITRATMARTASSECA